MTKIVPGSLTRLVVVLVLVGLAIAPGRAQQAPAATAQKPPQGFKVDVVLARFQADKKVSSLPFVLYGTAQPPRYQAAMSLRLGVDVPIGSAAAKDSSGAPLYRNVGTSIDCYIEDMGPDGRYPVRISAEDSSIFTADGDAKVAPRVTDLMAFRAFQFNNVLLLKDGQSAEFISAVDKISGDVLKVTATLTVVK